MRILLVVWVLWCVSTRAGSLPGGHRQGDTLPINPSLRKLQDLKPFVFGGQDAPAGRFPYACSLRALGTRRHRCGGTLITSGWVLTAAHCFSGDNPLGPQPLVYVGALGINDDSFAEVILGVEVIIHESFTGDVKDGFDIALVRLKVPSKRKLAVEAAQSGLSVGDGQFLVIAGWGRTKPRGPLPSTLQFADQLENVSIKNCEKGWPFVTDSMICAVGRTQAACEGDSGGPLLIADSKGGDTIIDGSPNLDILVGIVSLGPKECDSTTPDVYTKVSTFRPWIDDKMRDSLAATPQGASSGTGYSRRRNTNGSQNQKAPKCTEGCETLNANLYRAARRGELQKVKELLLKGADFSVKHGRVQATALQVASKEGHIDIVKALIEAGASVNARNYVHRAPLHDAAYSGNPALILLLLDNGAEIEARDKHDYTPVLVAAFFGSGEVIGVLLEAGADTTARSESGVDINGEVCLCLKSPGQPCREGTCGKGEQLRIKAMLDEK